MTDPRFFRELRRTIEPGSARDLDHFLGRVSVKGVGTVSEQPSPKVLALAGAIYALGRGIGEAEAMKAAKALVAEMESQARH